MSDLWAFAFGAAVAAAATAAVLRPRFRRQLDEVRRALSRSDERLTLSLRAAKIAVWEWDIAADVITADESSSMLFGLPLGTFPRTVERFSALLHPDDRIRVQQEIGAAVEQGTEYSTQFRSVWPDGSVRYLAARAHLYGRQGPNPGRLTGVCWDVTERRRAEETLQAANNQLSQSLADLKQRKEHAAVLSEMTDLLRASSQSADAYDIVAKGCARLFPAYAGALYIFSASRNLVNRAATWNDPVGADVAFDPDDCWALRRGHPHVMQSGEFATSCRHVADAPSGGHACFPLIAQGTGLGIVYFQRHNSAQESGSFFSSAERELATMVAEQVGLSLANIALQEALKFQSIRDPLTGLFNRRYLEESVERELHRAARRDQPAAVLMLDLDHFKQFNDTFGHEGGDALLRAFGQFLREHMRKEDIACRYGGEEFCILFCESPLDDTLQRANQLRVDLKRLSVQHGGRPLGVVTSSIGAAAYPTHARTVSELIAAADAALYRAKAEGRDRVVVAGA